MFHCCHTDIYYNGWSYDGRTPVLKQSKDNDIRRLSKSIKSRQVKAGIIKTSTSDLHSSCVRKQCLHPSWCAPRRRAGGRRGRSPPWLCRASSSARSPPSPRTARRTRPSSPPRSQSAASSCPGCWCPTQDTAAPELRNIRFICT